MGFNKVNYWDMCAIRHSDPELREDILAGYMQKGWKTYEALCDWPDDMDSVLDFGTGLGRNLPFLLRYAGDKVFVLDRPAMLVRLKAELHRLGMDDNKRIVICDDAYGTGWSVDLIYMSLVLQHVEGAESVWMHLPRHRYLVIRGRSRHDQGGSTWAKIPRDSYRLLECVEELNPQNVFPAGASFAKRSITDNIHGMDRVFDELRSTDNERHFEILLEKR